MNKKYQIFVSSTFVDLKDERQDAIRNILDLGHIPAGMELFPAADVVQLDYIKKIIDECDYYVLIMGGRYGSIDDGGISYTEREYDYAVETGKVVLAFPFSDISQLSVAKTDTLPAASEALKTFRKKVMTGRLVREWQSREQLEVLVLKALMHAFTAMPAEGWIRGGAVASEDLLLQINQLRERNDALLAANEKSLSKSTVNLENLVSLDKVFPCEFLVRDYDQQSFQWRPYCYNISWRDIFCIVGVAMVAPVPENKIAEALVSHFMQRNRVGSPTKVEDASLAVIKRHLVALGLIRFFSQESDKLGHHISLVELTELGDMKLTELLAVREIL